MINLFIYYRTTKGPWGGVNSFVRAFKEYSQDNGISLSKYINDPYDVALISGPYKDKTHLVDISKVISLKQNGVDKPFLKHFIQRKPKKIIYRCDGFRDEYANLVNDSGDEVQKRCLQTADHVIFQTESSLKAARRKHIGYDKKNYSIVYNGVNQNIFKLKQFFWKKNRPLRFFAANWSSNPNKGYKTIASFSELPDVEVTFCGRWPSHIVSKNVRLLAPKPQNLLAKEFIKHDVLLHPSRYDQSPNICLEAISCGLPIIYHPVSGLPEIAGDCGIAIDEQNLQETLDVIKNNFYNIIDTIRQKREFYSIQRCIKQYCEVFKQICG